LNFFSDARNTSISLDKTLVRVPNDSFRQNATLAQYGVALLNKTYEERPLRNELGFQQLLQMVKSPPPINLP
jgi:hypothetical protein